MKFKLIAAILGFLIAIPGTVSAQNPDDQVPDQDSQVAQAPSVQVPMSQEPNDQDSMDQGPMNPGSMGQGSNDPGSGDPSYSAPAPDETNAGVARISLIHGDVSTQRGDSNDWSAAALNAPVLAGDRVSTGDNARAELQLDYANILRLSERSQANITTLTHSQIQIQLGRGMASFSVYKNSDADAEIDTPNVAIRTNRHESSFRIMVAGDDRTEVMVRTGEVEVTTPQGGTRVGPGQFITVQGTADQAQYKISDAPARDAWDQWSSDRDNTIRNAASRRRTNDYYVGAEDLDAYGTWTEVPDYGPVWRPTVQVGWAPYRAGRWVYEPYWGWTWVSYDPWGWAPYHYGRWMMYDGAWAWWPGPAYGYPYYRPIWAPAYVSFFGFGGGFGFGVGFGGWGSIGWLPLGPCDRFHPWYGRHGGRFGVAGFNTFNRGGFAPLHGGTRFSNVQLALHDQRFRGGTTVSANQFGRGRMNAQPMSHAAFQNARFATGRLPVTPSRESFSASGRSAAASTIPNRSQNQRFFSARGTSAAAPRSFERGQSQNSNFNRQDGSSTGNGREASRPGNSNSNNGFQRFGQSPGTRGNSNGGSAPRSGNSGSFTPSRQSSNSNGGGWQKFSPMPRSSSSESNRAAGSYGTSRNSGSEGRGNSASSRPPLNMRQPIVTPRSSGGGAYNNGRAAPSYSGARSAPSSQGAYSGARPAPDYSGGGRSAPSYSGAQSAPSSRGPYSGARSAPGYSGGGRSAPSSSGARSAPSSRGGGSSKGSGSSHGGGDGRRGR